jgi:hypothetical protein
MAEFSHVEKGDQFSGGGASFKYRGVDRVVFALSAAMRKQGLVMVPAAHTAPEFVPVQTSNGKQSNMVRLLVTYRIYGPECGAAADFIEVTVPGEAMDSGDKAVSKAMSVAWRTALLQTFFLPTGDPDPDSEVHEMANVRVTPADTKRLEEYDAAIALWEEQIKDVWNDYEALGKLLMRARQAKAPQEVIDAVMRRGKELKPS